MKNYILKYILFSFSLLPWLSSCTGNQQETSHSTPIDSTFTALGNNRSHIIFICLSAYDCISCYKPVYDAIRAFRCSNSVYLSSSIREAEEKQFSETLRDKTGLPGFTFIENPALFYDIYNRAGLKGPNTIAVFSRNGEVLYSSALKTLSEDKLEELKKLYCE